MIEKLSVILNDSILGEVIEGLENQLQLQLSSNAFFCWGKGVFVKHILLIATLILKYMYVVNK